jgi:xanthine dehydrogenase YagS FAD-binding subunit
MRPFTYIRAATVDDAVAACAAHRDAKFLGGGTNLVDLMKMGVEQPLHVIDITRVPLNKVEEHQGGVRIGALVPNSDAANHPLIRERYPLLTEALLAGASPQLRNLATMGGNLLQRTRCYYFYDPSYAECNKRAPGSGCAAIHGVNRIHAILGASPACIATHPSDMCVALAALDAVVRVQGPKGPRSIPMAEFHRLPGNTPQIETNLQPGEMITAIDLPALSFGRHAHYLKVRDRNSYAFALVSVAAMMDVGDQGTIREARIALGGVAHKPWRVPSAERSLHGQKPGDAVYAAAARTILAGAMGYRDNAFKIPLAERAIVRALNTAASKQV